TVALGGEPPEVARRPDPAHARRPAALGTAADSRDAHPQRQRAPRDRRADSPQPEDADPQLGELPDGDLETRDLGLRPMLRRLDLPHPVEAAGEVPDGGARPVGDRIGVYPGGVREPNAGPPEVRHAAPDAGRA